MLLAAGFASDALASICWFKWSKSTQLFCLYEDCGRFDSSRIKLIEIICQERNSRFEVPQLRKGMWKRNLLKCFTWNILRLQSDWICYAKRMSALEMFHVKHFSMLKHHWCLSVRERVHQLLNFAACRILPAYWNDTRVGKPMSMMVQHWIYWIHMLIGWRLRRWKL